MNTLLSKMVTISKLKKKKPRRIRNRKIKIVALIKSNRRFAERQTKKNSHPIRKRFATSRCAGSRKTYHVCVCRPGTPYHDGMQGKSHTRATVTIIWSFVRNIERQPHQIH